MLPLPASSLLVSLLNHYYLDINILLFLPFKKQKLPPFTVSITFLSFKKKTPCKSYLHLQSTISPSHSHMSQAFTPTTPPKLSVMISMTSNNIYNSQSSYMTSSVGHHTLGVLKLLPQGDSPSLLCWLFLIFKFSPLGWPHSSVTGPLLFSSYRYILFSSDPMALKYQLYAYITGPSPPLNFRLTCPTIQHPNSYFKLKKLKRELLIFSPPYPIHNHHQTLHQILPQFSSSHLKAIPIF